MFMGLDTHQKMKQRWYTKVSPLINNDLVFIVEFAYDLALVANPFKDFFSIRRGFLYTNPCCLEAHLVMYYTLVDPLKAYFQFCIFIWFYNSRCQF